MKVHAVTNVILLSRAETSTKLMCVFRSIRRRAVDRNFGAGDKKYSRAPKLFGFTYCNVMIAYQCSQTFVYKRLFTLVCWKTFHSFIRHLMMNNWGRFETRRGCSWSVVSLSRISFLQCCIWMRFT